MRTLPRPSSHLSFKISGTQTYAGNDISGVNSMFAYATSLEGTIHIKNVSGLLALDLKGTDTVKSITVTVPIRK